MMLSAAASMAVNGIGAGPVGFEENKGQISDERGLPCSEVKFRTLGQGMQIFLRATGLSYQFEQWHRENAPEVALASVAQAPGTLAADALQWRRETYRIDMELVGADASAWVSTEGPSADFVHYEGRGALGVRRYDRVTFHEVYPHIDWVIQSTAEGMKYEFVVRPGGDPAQIKLRFDYPESIRLLEGNALEISCVMGKIREEPPVSFQGDRVITTAFALADSVVSFEVADYDPGQTLVIDPYLRWASYYGWLSYEGFSSCVVSPNGDLYLAGETYSSFNIAAGGHQNSYGGGQRDAFLVKMTSDCQRIWATYYGGSGNDGATNLTVDAAGNVYLCGYTSSLGGISFQGHQATYGGGVYDAFLAKFNASGQRQWATFYGGGGREIGEACTVDASGNVYLVGMTTSIASIAFNGFQTARAGTEDAFLVKFNSTGQRQWGTYYGAPGTTQGIGCDHDAAGNVYISGATTAVANIAYNGFQSTFGGGIRDAFLAKFDPAGARVWASYYGGAGDDEATCCRMNAQSQLCITGKTNSVSGIADASQATGFRGGALDAYLAKFDTAGARLWGLYYGGSGSDRTYNCAFDVDGNVIIAGETSSTDSIALSGHQNIYGGGTSDGFVTVLDSAGQAVWSSYYGGFAADGLSGIATFAHDTFYVAGYSYTVSDITLFGYDNTYNSGGDAFFAKFGDRCATKDESLTLFACDSIEINHIWYDSTGLYLQSLRNQDGCDSLLELSIAIGHPDSAAISPVACGSYTLHGQTYLQSGTYVQHLTTQYGCDSALTIQLTLHQPTFQGMTMTVCDSVSINGITYSQTGLYTQQLTNVQGCDSTLSLQITVIQSAASIAVSGGDLIASPAGASYRWLDCGSGGQAISGAQAQIFHPTVSGTYAVVVTQGSCVDTTGCESIVGVNGAMQNIAIQAFPNPFAQALCLQGNGLDALGAIQLIDARGAIVYSGVAAADAFCLDTGSLAAGMYMLLVQTGEMQRYLVKVVKE